MADSKWSDDTFLDRIRATCDERADACVLASSDAASAFQLQGFMAQVRTNASPLPDDAPQALREFFEENRRIPLIAGQPFDRSRAENGQRAFLRHSFAVAMVLLAKSLPEGYAAPCLSNVLALSGELRHHPYRRLMGVLQLLIDVCTKDGFEDDGAVLVDAIKLRLQHAGIRRFVVPKALPEYESQYGVAMNLEDMLGTIMGFSLLVLEGLPRLHVHWDEQSRDDYYYLWRAFGQMMGIHPPGQPDSSEFIPETIADAQAFYASYARRHYTSLAENPHGQHLALANLQLIGDLFPLPPILARLRSRGWLLIPRIYMQRLTGREGLTRVGVKPVRGMFVLRGLLIGLIGLWAGLWGLVDRVGGESLHEKATRGFFQRLIDIQRGRVSFTIPHALGDLQKLDEKTDFGNFIDRAVRRGPAAARQEMARDE